MLSEYLSELGFKQLSPGVSAYESSLSSRDPRKSRSSRLIILFAWAFAHPKNVAKYLQVHQKMDPDARILVIQDTMRNVFWNTRTRRRAFFGSTIAFIQDFLDKMDKPQVLLHIFSNGGAFAAVQLHDALQDEFGADAKLPVSAIVFDSCPGKTRMKPIVKTLLLGLPSKNFVLLTLATWIAFVVYGITVVLERLRILESSTTKLYRTFNDADGSFLLNTSQSPKKSPIPRSYIYSAQDVMVFSIDVEEHAHIAVKRLKEFECGQPTTYVALEKFAGSQHVNHLKLDGVRYWNIIQDMWALC